MLAPKRLIRFVQILSLINSVALTAFAQSSSQEVVSGRYYSQREIEDLRRRRVLDLENIRENNDVNLTTTTFIGKPRRELLESPVPGQPAAYGNACPEGTYSVQLTDDQSAIALSFSAFSLESLLQTELDAGMKPILPGGSVVRPGRPGGFGGAPGRPGSGSSGREVNTYKQTQIISCAIMVPLRIPPQKRLKISYVDFSGFALMNNDQSKASLRSAIYFADPNLRSKLGTPNPIRNNKLLNEAKERVALKFDIQRQIKDVYTISTEDLGLRTIYSSCGGESSLYLATHLMLSTNDLYSKSMITLDSSGAAIEKTDEARKVINESSYLKGLFYLSWETCNN